MYPLLSINNLEVKFNSGQTASVDVKSIWLQKGRTLAIVGESGSGKSVTALSILQLLPKQAAVRGKILFSPDGVKQFDLGSLTLKEINKIRGNKIAMIFQEPMTSLNPVLTCGSQVIEVLKTHQHLSTKEARLKTIQLFAQVELPDPTGILSRYPHQLSGGQKQRVMIAMAMSCGPALLIADEPTTALDVSVQKNILDLIKKLQAETNLAVLLITHDLGLVADVADDIAVMFKGEIVEQGEAKEILSNPKNNYTKALLACRPSANSKGKKLPIVADFFQAGISVSIPAMIEPVKQLAKSTEPVLTVQDLTVNFPQSRNIFGKTINFFNAVNKVSFEVRQSEILGLVGESGCGKTTIARTILQFIKPSSGKILLNGTDISSLSPAHLRTARKDLQIVFQDPYGSLNPRLTIGEAIMEPMKVHQLFTGKNNRKDKMIALLEQVQLDADLYKRYPHEFSGGQRQRICIARALALQPSFLVFDESVSALDVSVQAQVLNLINDLKDSFDFTAIFISHDLAVVHYICDRILVMEKGKIIESGTANQVYFHPNEPYTQKLIAAIPGKKLVS